MTAMEWIRKNQKIVCTCEAYRKGETYEFCKVPGHPISENTRPRNCLENYTALINVRGVDYHNIVSVDLSSVFDSERIVYDGDGLVCTLQIRGRS